MLYQLSYSRGEAHSIAPSTLFAKPGGGLTQRNPPTNRRGVKSATIRSACECQSLLLAELDERKLLRRGWSADPVHGRARVAPAHSIDPTHERFQVAWACPVCGRNTLRAFETSGLRWDEFADATA